MIPRVNIIEGKITICLLLGVVKLIRGEFRGVFTHSLDSPRCAQMVQL